MKVVKTSTNNPDTLLNNEDNYRHITQHMPVAVYTIDQNGLITFYNEKAAELWGQRPQLNNPDESRFCGAWKLFELDGTLMPHDECPMATALQYEHGFRNEEFYIERPDGSRITALVNIDLIYDVDGNLKGAINVFYDITERNRTENDARRLAAIVTSSEDAIISKNLNGIITSWNQAAERIFGYTEAEMVGKSIMQLIPPSRYSEENEIINKIKNGEPISHFSTIRVRKDGKRIHISLTVSPIKNAKGQIIGASKIARDITEQVQVQRRMKLYNTKLKKLNKYKDDFIGLVSHELKTPLTIVKGFLQLMEMDVQDDNQKTFMGKALLQVDKLSYLISDLLDVSKILKKKLQLNFSTFDVSELIDECIENIQISSPDHQFINKNASSNLSVTADRQRIEQVVINFLSNAVKYSPGKNEVVIRTCIEDDMLMVSVQDFGVGIPDHYLKKIFSRFFRVEEQGKFPGLGIGLYISKEIIDRHKGKIWVDSEVDKGSIFYFKIPFTQ